MIIDCYSKGKKLFTITPPQLPPKFGRIAYDGIIYGINSLLWIEDTNSYVLDVVECGKLNPIFYDNQM